MKSVGKQLQAARLAKNWTPELAARETKIKVDRLRDLEADDYTHFTSPAYARGFVRTYARALGLDEYQILRQLDNKLPDDDTPNLVTESNVGYLPETSMPPLVAHRDYTGLYVLLTLGCGVVLIFAFVLFELYRIGELPRYFASATSSDSVTPDVTNVTTNAAPTDSTARALPVDASASAPVVAAATGTTTPDSAASTNAPARALPVDPAELASATNAVTNPDAPVHAARALPVDPSELTSAPAATVSTATVDGTSPMVADVNTTNAPRALPVDLNALNTNAAPVTAAPAATPTPPVLITSISARQSNARPVPTPAPAVDPAPASSSQPPTAPVIAEAVGAPTTAPASVKPLILTASQDSFVRVTSQDTPGEEKSLYASVLHSGQSISFDGRKFSINVGVPSAVDIKLDGVNYGPHSDQETPQTFTVESHQP